MHELIFILHKKDKEALGPVRCMDGLLIAVNGDQLWLRGVLDNGSIDKSIRLLPVQQHFYIGENNLLFHPATVTPVAILPELQWMALAEFINIELPVAALPGQPAGHAAIHIIPSEKNESGTALITTLEQWKAYAENAPAIRLAPLQFVVSQLNDVLIIGKPLPPIPGKEFWMMGNILLPCGYAFEIPMAANFINEKLNPHQDALLLFDSNGSFEKIERSHFVPAKRSGIRLTQVIVEEDQ